MAYFGCTDTHHAAADFKELSQRFSYVVLPLTEQDIYHGRRTVGELVKAAQGEGLAVWMGAWGIAGIFGGEGWSALRHLCPQSCRVQDELKRWTEVVVESGAEGAFLDEPRDRCCSVQGILFDLTFVLSQAGFQTHLCLSPEHPWLDTLMLKGQLTSVGTDPYNVFRPELELVPYIDDWANEAKRAAKDAGAQTHGWVRGFSVPAGQEDKIALSLKVWATVGVDRVGVWSYRPERVGTLANEQPEVAWKTICDGVDEFRE